MTTVKKLTGRDVRNGQLGWLRKRPCKKKQFYVAGYPHHHLTVFR